MPYTMAEVAEKLDQSMPSLSPTATKVMRLANDINCPPAELTKVIKLDPVLSAKVLKLVNSSYFSLSTKVMSLEKDLDNSTHFDVSYPSGTDDKIELTIDPQPYGLSNIIINRAILHMSIGESY